ncbi:hypothetical protein [Halosimplex amylolyticum]|uniref:hypothetical protein n=1 Tax=Halosimplex amylolyticum TaxID=3396616 RepID=UPI003F567616
MYADPDPECDDAEWGRGRAMPVPVAVAAAFAGVYLAVYGFDRYLDYAAMLGPRGEWLQFAVVAGVVGLHGAVHAVAYALLGEGSWRDAAVDASLFPGGVDPVRVTVFPDGPIRRSAYLVGVAAPGVLLGVVPATWALVTGNPLALFVGLVGVLLTGSDVGELIETARAPDAAGTVEFASS